MLSLGSIDLMEIEIMTLVISVSIPIPMPRFQCRGLQMAKTKLIKENSVLPCRAGPLTCACLYGKCSSRLGGILGCDMKAKSYHIPGFVFSKYRFKALQNKQLFKWISQPNRTLNLYIVNERPSFFPV